MRGRLPIRSLALALALASFAFLAGPAFAVDGGRFGEVTVLEPKGPPRGLVVLFSDRAGWKAEEENAAQALAEAGALVVEVDTAIYLATFAKDKEECHWASGDAEQLSRRLQRERGWDTYQTPIMAGIGAGGTLARVTLSQAPPATFAGAVSIDPAPAIDSIKPFCSRGALTKTAAGFAYGPSGALPGFWLAGLTPLAGPEGAGRLKPFQDSGAAIEIRKSEGSSDRGGWLAALAEGQLSAGSGPVGDLPLIELPVEHPSPLLAVILSGDGGWRDIDKSIADYFHRQGVPVVGFDSLHYFWKSKTPEGTAADIARVAETYREKWRADKIALIGYSFGADVLPFIYNRLPKSVVAHVTTMTLLGLSERTDFEIHVLGWVGVEAGENADPVRPEIDQVPPGIIQCVYGEEDTQSACRGLDRARVEIVTTPGGHHFGGDYEHLAGRILDGFRRRSGAAR